MRECIADQATQNMMTFSLMRTVTAIWQLLLNIKTLLMMSEFDFESEAESTVQEGGDEETERWNALPLDEKWAPRGPPELTVRYHIFKTCDALIDLILDATDKPLPLSDHERVFNMLRRMNALVAIIIQLRPLIA